MTETKMNVTLISHTQLSRKFYEENIVGTPVHDKYVDNEVSDGQLLALSAIRTCYSPNKPSEIVKKEGERYLTKKATDGKDGSEADRLIRMIVSSGHTSTLEGITFNFAVEGISRALLAQLTRHRVGFSFSVQSQRYVRFGSGDRSGGFDYVVPDKVTESTAVREIEDDNCGGLFYEENAQDVFAGIMSDIQRAYDQLRDLGIPAEDCRAVLPQAAACNLVLTGNLRSLLDFYSKRRSGKGAQKEISLLAERLKDEVIAVEPWTKAFFEEEAE